MYLKGFLIIIVSLLVLDFGFVAGVFFPFIYIFTKSGIFLKGQTCFPFGTLLLEV